MFATLQHRAVDYEPDLILVDVTLNSPWIFRGEEAYRRPFTPPAGSYPFLHSFALEQLLQPLQPASASPAPGQVSAQFGSALDRFTMFAEQLGKPLCFVILQHDRRRIEETDALRREVGRNDACVIDTSLAFRDEGFSNLTILKIDDHPNARAQKLFARTVFDFLVGQRMLGEAQ
jgi:hypothetical protein